jgi:ParB/RepB/Spo0J family partition protein
MRHALRLDAGSFITADPFRCRVWDLNDRIEEYITKESCRAEIASVERDGQLVPVVGRPLKDNADFDIEIVCGARRLFIARHLKIPVRVELRDLTDQQAAIAVATENTLRKQTSPYERGMWLAKLMRQGIYGSQDQMGRDLRITPTQITRLLKFSELPAIVIGAFSSPHDILESWGVELHKAWKDGRRGLLTERCRSLAATSPRPAAASVYEILLAPATRGGRSRNKTSSRILRSPDGAILLRFEHQLKEVVLRIPNALVNRVIETELTDLVAAVLTRRATRSDASCNISGSDMERPVKYLSGRADRSWTRAKHN